MHFNDRVVLVTGSSSGFGASIAKSFLERGAKVYGCGLDMESKITDANYEYIQADLTSYSKAVKVANRCYRVFGGIDCLINSAGITGVGNADDTSIKDFKNQFEVNVFATYNMCKAAICYLKESTDASIINIASELGVKPFPNRIAYCPAKAAVVMLTQCLSIDYGPQIRVNAILPSLAETPMTKMRFEQADDPDELRNKMNNRYVMKRMCQPEDVAKAALFLASDLSSYITGDSLAVCGGGHIYASS